MVGVTRTNYEQLEKEYAKYVKSKFAVSCNSGTSALHLALMALGIGKGDEVIMPDFTMAACGFAVSYTGAKPVFVDCGEDLNIDVTLIERKITKKTKAIMAVHIYGRLCDMAEILRIAKKHNLYVIEDACEAQGAVFNSKADITCYSFFKNKIIHAEEGGICTTNNKKWADRMNYLKNMAFGEKHDYFHEEIGYNYRLPEQQAKMALESLRNVDKNLALRRKKEQELDRIIGSQMPKRDVVWVYDFLGSPPEGFDTRPFFRPLSSFPMYGGKCQSPRAELFSLVGNYIKLEV
jgi:dTDP-4-amino-4,6-dideoxygalactose transaminase